VTEKDEHCKEKKGKNRLAFLYFFPQKKVLCMKNKGIEDVKRMNYR